MGDVINLADRRQEKAEQEIEKIPWKTTDSQKDNDLQERIERIKASLNRLDAIMAELRSK